MNVFWRRGTDQVCMEISLCLEGSQRQYSHRRVRFAVQGNTKSVLEESFEGGCWNTPNIRDRRFKRSSGPEAFAGGHHEKINKWREAAAKLHVNSVQICGC